MENSIINKISSIIMSEYASSEENMSLLSYIEFMNKVNLEINKLIKNTLKKLNNKLSNNIAFFNYEIKNIEMSKNLVLIINRELTTIKVEISLSDYKVKSDLKNKEVFEEIVKKDLSELMISLKKYDYLDRISIKTKDKEINIVINPKNVEIFMHKSPNWITMGKAFSLIYDFVKEKFIYNIDSIGLETNIKNQEKLLFSKLYFQKNLLPLELQEKMLEYSNIKEEKNKTNIFARIFNKLRNMMKK